MELQTIVVERPCMTSAEDTMFHAVSAARPPAQKVEHEVTEMHSSCCGTSPSAPKMESVFSLPARRGVHVKKVYLIVNPYGGKGRGKLILQSAKEEFGRCGTETVVLETQHKRHAEEYARTIPLAGFDALCAIGGDGTFNEVVNGLLTRQDRQKIPLGFIAGGTGNSTMVDLKAVDTRECVAAICSGVVRAMDVIRIDFFTKDGTPGAPKAFKSFDSPQSRYFINALGFGLGVQSAMTAEGLRCLGQMRYDVGAVYNIAKGFCNPAVLELDGTKIDQNFAIIVVSNGESMTFRFAPSAKVDDGFMDVTLLAHVSRARVFGLFDQVKQGYRAPRTGAGGVAGGGGGAHVFCPEVKHYRCKEMALRPATPGTYNVDGEILGAGCVRCTVVEPIEILFQLSR